MFGTDGRQVVETRLAELLWDIVWFLKGDECGGVLEVNEAMFSAETEVNCGLKGGHANVKQMLR